MKQNHTDITLVLDRSGSMAEVRDDTIGGVNTFIDDQKKAPGTADFTLHQFDDTHETPIKTCDIKTVNHLTRDTFIPRGSTALLDAIGRAVIDTGKRLEGKPEHERASKVVMVIVTDGQENCSQEFTREKIFEMIKHQRETYKWEFVFLGANQDAIAEATKMGMSGSNAIKYASNSVGTKAVFRSASSNLKSYRSGEATCMAFSAEDKQAQEEAGLGQS